jgi:hypothetical protein
MKMSVSHEIFVADPARLDDSRPPEETGCSFRHRKPVLHAIEDGFGVLGGSAVLVEKKVPHLK